jgi:hypothetical protein
MSNQNQGFNPCWGCAQKITIWPKKSELCPRIPPIRSSSRWIEGWLDVDEMITAEMAVILSGLAEWSNRQILWLLPGSRRICAIMNGAEVCQFRGCKVSLWIELGVSTISLLLMVVLSVYITRFATIPLLREIIASAQKRRLGKQHKAGN